MNTTAMLTIKHDETVLAIIIPAEFNTEGIQFFTPNDYSQQVAYMNRPAGYEIVPHTHTKVTREVYHTLETLFVRRGKVKIDFYTSDRKYVQSYVAKTGDAVLLVSGGHGFTMLEPTEMIEVKQGPYAGDADKVRFSGI